MQIKAFSGRFEAVEAILGTFPFSKMFPSRKFFEISPSIAILRGIFKNAIRIEFDDMHDTGIFSWDILYRFGIDQDKMWVDYLEELEALGLSREP